jgi:hypothetical protein
MPMAVSAAVTEPMPPERPQRTQFTADAVNVVRSSDDFGPTVTSPESASMRSTYNGA